MKTLHDLYLAVDGDSLEYDRARRKKVDDIAAYLSEGLLREGVSPEIVAEQIMTSAEAMERFDGDFINGEVRGSDTIDGTPLTLTI